MRNVVVKTASKSKEARATCRLALVWQLVLDSVRVGECPRPWELPAGSQLFDCELTNVQKSGKRIGARFAFSSRSGVNAKQRPCRPMWAPYIGLLLFSARQNFPDVGALWPSVCTRPGRVCGHSGAG